MEKPNYSKYDSEFIELVRSVCFDSEGESQFFTSASIIKSYNDHISNGGCFYDSKLVREIAEKIAPVSFNLNVIDGVVPAVQKAVTVIGILEAFRLSNEKKFEAVVSDEGAQ